MALLLPIALPQETTGQTQDGLHTLRVVTDELTILFHPGERLDTREDLGELGHPLRSLLLVALPFDLLLRQHLLEHLQGVGQRREEEDGGHRCSVSEEELARRDVRRKHGLRVLSEGAERLAICRLARR